jgi:hypothetical protein
MSNSVEATYTDDNGDIWTMSTAVWADRFWAQNCFVDNGFHQKQADTNRLINKSTAQSHWPLAEEVIQWLFVIYRKNGIRVALNTGQYSFLDGVKHYAAVTSIVSSEFQRQGIYSGPMQIISYSWVRNYVDIDTMTATILGSAAPVTTAIATEVGATEVPAERGLSVVDGQEKRKYHMLASSIPIPTQTVTFTIT